MIIKLEDAKAYNDKITQSELDSLESSLRALTNNHFQVRAIRYHDLEFSGNQIIAKDNRIIGIKQGDTIQVSGSILNNGLYVVSSIDDSIITVEHEVHEFYESSAFLTLVTYPAEIKAGVIKLIKYDAEMIGKTGVKSRTISRMSESYFDAADTINGYPAHLMSFIEPYRCLRRS